ncbi:cytochrome P450 [Streptomyces sp. NPDC002896]|uniref:cytochrome P450 n=1 Tax=Streptomyces sp. NPDC002896 TaxID=3154438 RepID=UPI00331E3227
MHGKDDPQHKAERDPFSLALRPAALRRNWMHLFEETSARYIDRMRQLGPGADLLSQYAEPFVADNLSAMLGFADLPHEDFVKWSHTLVEAATTDVGPSPEGEAELWDRSIRVSAEIDLAIDEAIERTRREPDGSVIATLSDPQVGAPLDTIRANVKLAISGGMNEPSHVLAGAVWALLSAPEQYRAVESGERSHVDVFDEAARLLTPLGMVGRFARRDTELAGVPIPAGAPMGLVLAAANHDELRFPDPERFDLYRDRVSHLAFGNGTHLCVGSHAARTMIAKVGLPRLFEQLPNLRLTDADAVSYSGWVFRSPNAVQVDWD